MRVRTITKPEVETIAAIAGRAWADGLIEGAEAHQFAFELALTHAGPCRLRLDEMLAARAFDLAHDLYGIRRHLDLETGQLRDCFRPRFAARDELDAIRARDAVDREYGLDGIALRDRRALLAELERLLAIELKYTNLCAVLNEQQARQDEAVQS